MGTITWTGTITALSSITHGEETRGTYTMLRRELVTTADGSRVLVPIISGNTLRGRLRRTGEELLRDAVGYAGEISPAAAHTLRGGGSLAKTGREPLSGARLARLRELVPQLGVFGGAGGGTIISGALDVGKVIPHVAETARITGVDARVSAFEATQLEAYTRQDDDRQHDFAGVAATAHLTFSEDGKPAVVDAGGNQMRFHVETFPIGTTFSTWLRLRRPTDLETAFFTDVLAQFARDGRLGGRIAIGHGQVRADLHADPAPDTTVDWRAVVAEHRDEILVALESLV
ncbi:hypothetical protein Xcel_3395 (plasmid) [Xylanimonas cellulosilytica DSM 15894]|uniref:CRISPR-associated RAMP protein, SSO1426 family n=1 Tax=Xylanimonas cellulosilytica (strain DSM 15894 / JCM 12276 / CECT 5975 / KCTC 9989 / LMG 20990 / NBRC 107835 / XIL07) TaxID=446471 RepID=D1C0S8_XYLCX|nr:hypothetical protein [Xylanimonas cellulosilytica]ACZ32394.1 hypothetical protein Xcel_3395 [Xylanimonas cellulosilytica DSM 15894]